MNFYAISGLANGIVSTVCGAIIFYLNPRSHKNRLYALYCVSLATWSYFYCAWHVADSASSALFFCRALMMGAIFIPTFHYHHILSLFDIGNPTRKKILYIAYGLTAIFFISNFTPLFVSRVEPRMSFPYWPVPGLLFHPYLALFVVLLSLSIHTIWEYRHNTTAVIQNGMAWVVFATLLGYGGGASNFPLWYKIPIPPLFNLTVSVYVAINALLFFRLQLIDIQLFLRNTTVHLLASLMIGGVYSIFVYIALQSLGAVAAILVFAVLIPLVYQPIYLWVRESINKTRLGKIDQYLEAVDASMDKIRESTYTYDDLAKNLVDAVTNTFPVEMVAVYFLDTHSKEFYLRSATGMKNPLVNDLRFNRASLSIMESDPLIQSMIGRKQVVVKEEILASPQRREGDRQAVSRLIDIEGEICVPFLFANRVHGILVMGKKKRNQMYHQDDLQAVYSFGRMGEEIMRYIMGMEHEVHHAALYSHDMNNDTKSLVQTLQFVRSPLGKMANPDKLEKMLTQAEDVAVRLNQSFALNRDRSALILKSIKGEYEKVPVDVVNLMRESCSKQLLRAEEKHVRLEIDFPNKPVMVDGNEDDLIRIMDNLLSNALRYVKQSGLIQVHGVETKNNFTVTVADDGEGIDAAIIERIWDFGWQVKDAKQGASGLGLSIVKQIVQLHDGTIQVESNGKDKGTKFTVIIPLLSFKREDEK